MARFRISREEFESLPSTRTSRWKKLMDKVAKSNDPHEAQLDKDERTPEALHKVRRQIRSAAWRRGINIRIRTVKGMIFVQAVEEEG